MPTSTYARPATLVRRLGLPHFAHLRAVVEGVPPEDAAARYLAADTRPTARAAHAQVLQRLSAVVRRRRDPRWRLVALIGRLGVPPAAAPSSTAGMPAKPTLERPSLEDWAAAKGIDVGDWGERELVELYEADCPVDTLDPTARAGQRRALRAVRLRERQLELLRELEPVAAEAAEPSDLIDGWFDDVTAERLKRAGLLRLDELQRRIARGGRWYAYLPAIGATKAQRIAQYLAQLLPPPKAEASAVAFYGSLLRPAPMPGGALAGRPALLLPAELDGSAGTNRSPAAAAGTRARNDLEAVEAWLLAKAGEPGKEGFVATTEKVYRIEAERFLLWCLSERGKPLSSVTSEDCAAYRAFLANIPERWISRRAARRYGPGWTPFAGPLTVASQQHALTRVGGLFKWLVSAHYLHADPWQLVKTRLGDDPRHGLLDSRAFTPAAWAAINEYVSAQPPSPAQARTAFVLHFVESVGLRADELVSTQLGQFARVDDGWAMQVHGKGALNRVATVPAQAVQALNRYLAYRGLPPLGEAGPLVPLAASVNDPLAHVSYRALYDSLKAWFRRALRSSSLSPAELDVALRATPHWLRHTCGTRALERGVTTEELQEQFGHADPRTTRRYSKVQLQKRQRAFGKAFA